jgi:hypothetical protein
MRPTSFLLISVAVLAGCSNTNLMGEQMLSDERLARTEVEFGREYVFEDDNDRARSAYVSLRPNNSYTAVISERTSSSEWVALSTTEGRISQVSATVIRRNLAQIRSNNRANFYNILPGCPFNDHVNPEFAVAFITREGTTATMIEPNCDTPEAEKGRRIISDALKEFRLDRIRLQEGVRGT